LIFTSGAGMSARAATESSIISGLNAHPRRPRGLGGSTRCGRDLGQEPDGRRWPIVNRRLISGPPLTPSST
jgi:hypothetical protein